MVAKRSIRDLDLRGKRTFIRVDFNVPLEHGNIIDETRIRAALPTIQYAIDKEARVILASHLGRPKGKRKLEYSLRPVAEKLSQMLGKRVRLAPDCVGEETACMVAALEDGDVLLLENLRFHAEEEANDLEFAQRLAALGDLYVNDAFGAAHRAHASTEGITHYVKPAVAGFLMEKELHYLSEAITAPRRPLVVILGGAKISDKVLVVGSLVKTADVMLIGGAMAYTFLKGRGIEVGRSLIEPDYLELVRQIERRAWELGVKLLLPVDHVVAGGPDDMAGAINILVEMTPMDSMGLDIGIQTRAAYIEEISRARTIIWNGPMGMFERGPFCAGTYAIAQAVAEASARRNATSIVGGGDSIAAVSKVGVADKITHISTGGGATLELLAGKTLPGVAALGGV